MDLFGAFGDFASAAGHSMHSYNGRAGHPYPQSVPAELNKEAEKSKKQPRKKLSRQSSETTTLSSASGRSSRNQNKFMAQNQKREKSIVPMREEEKQASTPIQAWFENLRKNKRVENNLESKRSTKSPDRPRADSMSYDIRAMDFLI